jgi:homogentisate 1,2-dioxygenase
LWIPRFLETFTARVQYGQWSLEDDLMVEHMNTCGETNARNWLFHMIETMPHDQFTRMVVTIWATWTARRKATHEEVFQSPISLQ